MIHCAAIDSFVRGKKKTQEMNVELVSYNRSPSTLELSEHIL